MHCRAIHQCIWMMYEYIRVFFLFFFSRLLHSTHPVPFPDPETMFYHASHQLVSHQLDAFFFPAAALYHEAALSDVQTGVSLLPSTYHEAALSDVQNGGFGCACPKKYIEPDLQTFSLYFGRPSCQHAR